MFALVDIGGNQVKVTENKKILVNRLKDAEGAEISFDKVLLVKKDDLVNVGTPYIPGASVNARVVSHKKGEKVLVFKKIRRKGYRKLNGHRQYLTQLEILKINS